MRRRVATWLRDAALRRVLRHGIMVSAGKLAGQLASLVSVAVLARQLGPELFGVLALIRTVATVTEAYANFNTWQAVIKYGMEAIASGRKDDVRRIIKLAVLIDLATAAVASLVIVGLALSVPTTFGWSHPEAMLCALYSITVLTRTAGACDGIFRIFDAYRAQAIATVFQAIAPMVAVIIAAALHTGLDGAVIALICGETIGNLIDTVVSFYITTQRGYGGWWRTSLSGVRTSFPGVLRFMFATNVQLTVKKTQIELDMIVVGAMLGKVASGLFKLVKQLGKIPSYIFMPFEQVLFAELSRCAAENDYTGFRRLVRRFTGIVLLGGLMTWAVVALAANPLVRLVAGADFVACVPALRVYLLAMVVSLASTPTQRALIALGRPGTLLVLDLGTLATLFGTLIAGGYYWGNVGIAGAVLVHKLIQLSWSTWLVYKIVRQRRSHATAPPSSLAQP